jgi:hypothetical protein
MKAIPTDADLALGIKFEHPEGAHRDEIAQAFANVRAERYLFIAPARGGGKTAARIAITEAYKKGREAGLREAAARLRSAQANKDALLDGMWLECLMSAERAILALIKEPTND